MYRSETSFIVCSEKSLPIGTSKSPKFLIVFHLPRGSPAIRYRPYLESVNGTTLVDWAVNRFSNLFPVTIAHPDPSELGAFAAAAESAAASVVICCGIEAALRPVPHLPGSGYAASVQRSALEHCDRAS